MQAIEALFIGVEEPRDYLHIKQERYMFAAWSCEYAHVSEPLRESDLVAYVGPDDPDHDLFNGQPGVVIDTGQMPVEVAVSLAWGPSLCVPAREVARISPAEYRERSDRMRSGRHPLRDVSITPLDSGDPLAGPQTQP